MKKKLLGMGVLAGVAAMLLLIPAMGLGQPGGKGGKGGKGGGPGGTPGGGKGGFDPSKIFDMIANGNDFIRIDDLKRGKAEAVQWAQENGVTNGQLTRDQYTTYMNWLVTSGNMGGGKGGKGGPGGPQFKGGGGAGNGQNAWDADQVAVGRFKLADRNGDGFLDQEEMSDKLKAVWQKYDKNGDGLIDLEEYKAFFRDVTSGGQGNNGLDFGKLVEEEWDQRPTVFRAGKLPKELPAWFTQLDKDLDGQVGLYEWRAAGKPIAEFQAMDRNQDGLLTAEEVLWYLKITVAKAGDTPSLGSEFTIDLPNPGTIRMSPGMGGQRPGPGMGGTFPGGNPYGGGGGKGGKGGKGGFNGDTSGDTTGKKTKGGKGGG